MVPAGGPGGQHHGPVSGGAGEPERVGAAAVRRRPREPQLLSAAARPARAPRLRRLHLRHDRPVGPGTLYTMHTVKDTNSGTTFYLSADTEIWPLLEHVVFCILHMHWSGLLPHLVRNCG